MKKLKLFAILMSVLIVPAWSADKDTPVEWTSMEKALSHVDASHQFIFIDIVAPWCGWCKKMDESTFTDENVSEQLRNNFVTVKLDAEAETPVSFNGKSYGLTQNGTRKTNQLAMDLGKVNGRLGYPTLVVLDEKGNKIQAFPGYKDAETLNILLKYFLSGNYKKMDFQQFQSGN
jgi:thioredoxin-related protein